MLPALLPDLMTGLGRWLLHYISKMKSGCGTFLPNLQYSTYSFHPCNTIDNKCLLLRFAGSRNTFIPTMPALSRCTVGSKFQVHGRRKINRKPFRRGNLMLGMGMPCLGFGIPQLCVRINTLQHLRMELEIFEKRVAMNLGNADDIGNGLGEKFELSPAACLEGIQQLSEATTYKVVFCNLSHVLWDRLYVGEPASTRIEPMLKELEHSLEIVSETVNDRVHSWVITDIMKASYYGFLLVLLSGGPSCAFSLEDSQIIEDGFRSLKDMFCSNGDGLPDDLINVQEQ